MKGNEKYAEFNKWELVEIVLRILGGGILIAASLSIPTLPFAVVTIIKEIEKIKNKPVDRRKVVRTLKLLQEKDILSFETVDNEVYVTVKEKFHPMTLKYSLMELYRFKKQKHSWNGNWYLLFFDIPEKQRIKRDQTRRFLKQLGFYEYQKSVYVLPYDCRNEIDLIKKVVEGKSFLKFIVTSEIEDEKRLKSYFNID